jgi:hypothetical protein
MRFLVYSDLRISKQLLPAFEKVRAAIERDDFRSADLKKLSSDRPYFRARLDYDSRLLVQLVRHGTERACLALEIIEHHAYDRSRFLRGARVDEARAVDASAMSTEQLDAASPALRYLSPGRADFQLLDKPISFDDCQAELYRLPLPLILVGCAGSGKTALTLTRLRQMRGEVLYVTQSAFLAESAASLYFAHNYENAQQNVDFLTFRKVLESIEVPKGRAVSAKDFRPFFERHRASCRFTSAHMLFEELRGVLAASSDGPLTKDAYLALGVRQSMYPTEERAAVYEMFGKYRAWLKEARLYDPSLLAHEYRARAERRYDAVVVDEIQDLTNAELALVLAMLKDARGFLLCGDANQIVHPNFFAWSKVKSLFYAKEAEALSAPIHLLGANYRSSRTVSELANRLLKVKNARFGSIDKESTALVRPVADLDGRVAGLVEKDAVLRDLDRVARASARVAVIVLGEEQKAEAKRRFSTPLIFSVLEAKGLEYDIVILYGLVSGERAAYRDIAEGVTQADIDEENLTFARAKDKSDKSLEAYKFFINALYVAVTRAIETVYVVESDPEHPLLGLLRVTFSEDVSSFTAKASSLEEWQKEARKLELQGKDEQAEAIRRTILRTTPVPWTVLYGTGFDDVFAKALAPNSVFSKAKQQLYELGAFHELTPLTRTAELRAGYRPVRSYDATVVQMKDRLLAAYRDGRSGEQNHRRVLDDLTRYGLEHRNMMSLTPLMAAAQVGNVPLVERLLEQGARVDAVDVFGRMPLHFALRSAFASASFAADKIGALYELLCPTGLDIECDGRLVRLSRNQGEFFALAAMFALFHTLYVRFGVRYAGFGATMLEGAAIEAFPRSVVPEERRKRTYWNGVLARAEETSTYRPARRLWRRERIGHYVPSRIARLRIVDEHGVETFRPLDELLRFPMLDELQRPSGDGFGSSAISRQGATTR